MPGSWNSDHFTPYDFHRKYLFTGSTPSLAMGVACGALMMYGAYQLGQDPKNVTLPLVTTAVLTGVMGYRFASTGKFMPAGMVATLSLLMVVRLSMRVMSQSN